MSRLGRVTLNRALYVGLAECIKRARDRMKELDDDDDEGAHFPHMRGAEAVAVELADAFEEVAVKFDRDLFLRNCGIES